MAVRDVYDPKDKNPENPSVKAKEAVEGDAAYWKGRAETSRFKREFEEEEARGTKAKEAPAESPFKVQGSVNLGNIDFQKQQEKLEASIAGIQHEHEEEIKKLRTDADGYRDKVHEIQFNMMQQMMETRMESLKDSLERNLVKPETKTVAEQITEINSLAETMGFKKVSADEGTPAAIRLDMMRLEMDEKARDRDFQRMMKADERNWQLKLEEIKINQQAGMAKIQAEREKTSMLAAAPEVIGRAIGKAMIEANANTKEPAAPPKQKRSTYTIEAGDGDAGEFACPECHGKIAVSPDARTAVCPGCNIRIPIKRIDRRGDSVEEE